MLIWILAVAAFYALIVLAYWFWQERLIYYPGPPPGAPPASAALDLREEWIETSDGERLCAWLARPRGGGAGAEGSPRGAVLVCHGNAGNIEARLPLAETFAEMDLAVLLFDYRGYGASSGRPSEEGTYADAEAAFDRLSRESGIPADRIAVYGESLGGAVAIELARRRKLAAVIVESSFTSMADIGSLVYPWLPVRWLVRARYDSAAKISRLGVPVLVIHSAQDDLIPYEHGRKLFDAAREPRVFLETRGRHNDGGFTQREEWKAAVRDFLSAAFGSPPARGRVPPAQEQGR